MSTREKEHDYQAAYYAANRDAIKARNAAHYAANRDVVAARNAAWYAANREKVAARTKANAVSRAAAQAAYRAANHAKIAAGKTAWRSANLDAINAKKAAYYAANRESICAKNCAYSASNRPKINARLRVYKSVRCKNDPNFRLRLVIRDHLRRIIKVGGTKDSTSLSYVGCTVAQLRKHLERQFLQGMTWKNHGTEWHIDHIAPLAAFDFVNFPAQIKQAEHYTNLRPMWASENMRKGDTLPHPIQLELIAV